MTTVACDPEYRERFIGVDEFVRDTLPGILEDRQCVDGWCLTYQGASSEFPGGPVPTEFPGLTMMVISGDSRDSRYTWERMTNALLTPSEQALWSHLPQERFLPAIGARNAHPLLFVYAGLSLQDTVNVRIEDLRRRIPDATIVVVTCTCNPTDKHMRFDPMLRDGIVHAVVETSGCGGHGAMRDLLRAVLDQWPKRRMHAVDMPRT